MQSITSFTSVTTDFSLVNYKLNYCCDCDGQTGRDQPVVSEAAAVTSDAVDNRYTGRYNAAPQVITVQWRLKVISFISILEVYVYFLQSWHSIP